MDYLEITLKPDPADPDVELVEVKGDHLAFQWMISAAGNARDGFTATADEQGPAGAGHPANPAGTRKRRRLVLEPLQPNDVEQQRRIRNSVHSLHERVAKGELVPAGERGSIKLSAAGAAQLGAEALAELSLKANVEIVDGPAADVEREHPGHGHELEGIPAPADGSEVELEPIVAVGDLTTPQLAAILGNDVEAFPHAGRYEVPRAIAELERRRDAGQAAAGEELDLALERGRAVTAGQEARQAADGDAYEGGSS